MKCSSGWNHNLLGTLAIDPCSCYNILGLVVNTYLCFWEDSRQPPVILVQIIQYNYDSAAKSIFMCLWHRGDFSLRCSSLLYEYENEAFCSRINYV